MKTVAAIIIKATQYFLLGGILSFLLLLYLVITDPYFEKLDWKIEGFGEKVSVYHIYTQYIPMAFIVCCGIYSILLTKIKRERILRGCAALLTFMLFSRLDIKIKHLFIISQKIILNIGIIIVFYIVALIALYIYSKRVNR